MAQFVGFIKILAFLVAVFVVLGLPQSYSSLDFEGASEGPCRKVNTIKLNEEWARSVKPWYYPVMCRSDLYQTTSAVLNKPYEEIPENELYYKGCLTWQLDSNETASMSGFNGHRIVFNVNYTSGFEQLDFIVPETGDKLASCWSTLTDNRTFYVNVCCLGGKEIVWGVNSVTPSLPQETVKMIHEHAEGMGFSRKQFTGLQYDTC